MRILLILLAFVATPAWAGWVVLGKSDRATIYMDPTTIKKDGKLRRVWQLHDLKKPDDDVMSYRLLEEFDCKEERARILSISWFSGPMSGGELLHSESLDDKWIYVEPETARALIIKRVCAN